MRKRLVLALLVGAALLLAALAAVAAIAPSDITYRPGEYNGQRTGEVLVGREQVFSIRTSAGGLDPVERARIAAERLQRLPQNAYDPRTVSARPVGSGQAVYVGNTMIVGISAAEARAHGAAPRPAMLAEVWRDNLANAFRTGGTGGPPPNYPPGGPVSDWTGQKQKWVPILSVEQQGLRVGAAQVAGPAGQVDEVKGVAQFRLDFRNLARIYVYIPVSTLTVTRLDRVQGVSVWATGDIQLVGF